MRGPCFGGSGLAVPLRPSCSWLCDENTCEDRWPEPKGRLGSVVVGWENKMVAHQEIRGVAKMKNVQPKFFSTV